MEFRPLKINQWSRKLVLLFAYEREVYNYINIGDKIKKPIEKDFNFLTIIKYKFSCNNDTTMKF